MNKSKLKEFLNNRPIVSGLAIIAMAFTIGLVYATNATYAADASCPSGWDILENTSYCKKTFTATSTQTAKTLCENEIADLGLTLTEQSAVEEGKGYCGAGSETTVGYILQTVDTTTPTAPTVTLNANGGTFTNSAETSIVTTLSVDNTPTNFDEDEGTWTVKVSYNTSNWTLMNKAYTLKGWVADNASNCSNSSKIIATGGTATVYQDTTFYACWNDGSSSGGTTPTAPTITLNANGGTFTNSAETSIVTTLSVDNTPTNFDEDEGTWTVKVSYNTSNWTLMNRAYTLKGWVAANASNCSDSSKIIATGGTATVYQDTTFYACWNDSSSDEDDSEGTTSPKVFTATFNANGGTLSGNTTETCITSVGGSACTISSLPSAIRSNYEFNGWGTSTSCTSGSKSSLSLTSSRTYYACWVSKEETVTGIEFYTITYDLDGGKFPDGTTSRKQVLGEDKTLSEPGTNPIKDGYVFAGWYDGTTKFVFGKKITKNVTLKAKWERDDDTCEYKCNSGDVYDPSIGKCVTLEKFNNKPYIESIFERNLACSNELWQSTGSTCEGGCNTQSCSSGYTSDIYVLEDSCKIYSACSTDASKTCNETWRVYCYKTYNAEEVCDVEDIEQVPTNDILIAIVWFIGLFGLGFGIYYLKDLKSKQ